jgi:hypothetical protein
MDISKSSLIRFMFYTGIVNASSYINNLVYSHFFYWINSKLLCPAFGSEENCDLAALVGWYTVASGYILMTLLLLKSTETLKYNWVLNSLEPMICAAQVPVQIFFCIYFRRLSIRSCTIKNFTVQMFLSFFILNALFFANNCLLSYLEFIANDRFDQ